MSGSIGSYGTNSLYGYGGGQMAPQGIFGNILGGLAPQLGTAIGQQFGHGQLGGQIGQAAGHFAQMLPFQAQPGMAGGQQQGELDPQFLGKLVNVVRQAGNAVRTGMQIVNAVRQVAPGILPFALTPDQGQAGAGQMAPQGLFGNILGQIAPQLGTTIGQQFGQGQLGGQIGQAAGHFAQMLPFQAQPGMAGGQQQGELDPQFLSGLVNAVRHAANVARTGLQVVNAVRQVAPGLLPFALEPESQQAVASADQQLAPQGLFGNILGAVAGPVGGIFGGPVGGIVGGLAGRAAQRFIPFGAGPDGMGQMGMGDQGFGQQQLAPQGFIGNILGGIAPQLGTAIGQQFGQGQLGGQIGQAAGHFAQMLPFQAQPGMAGGQQQGELDPQFLGKLVNVVRQAGNAVRTGMQIVNAVRQVAPGILPFALAPDQGQAGADQMAPQGILSNLLGRLPQQGMSPGILPPHLQQIFRSPPITGLPNPSTQMPRTPAMLPFSAGPQVGAEQMAPQGLFGNILGQIAPQLGTTIGQQFGQGQLGGQIGQAAGHFAQMLPFQAQPGMAGGQQQGELDPQFLSGLVNAVRHAANVARTGLQVVNAVRQVAPGLLPFALEPESQQAVASADQQLAPQGLFGNILGGIAPQLGGALGGLLGNQQLGQQIGQTAGQFAGMLPFQAQPFPMQPGMAGQQGYLH